MIKYSLPLGARQTSAMGTGSCAECRMMGLKASALGGASVSVLEILVPVSLAQPDALFVSEDAYRGRTEMLSDSLLATELPIHPLRFIRVRLVPHLCPLALS